MMVCPKLENEREQGRIEGEDIKSWCKPKRPERKIGDWSYVSTQISWLLLIREGKMKSTRGFPGRKKKSKPGKRTSPCQKEKNTLKEVFFHNGEAVGVCWPDPEESHAVLSTVNLAHSFLFTLDKPSKGKEAGKLKGDFLWKGDRRKPDSRWKLVQCRIVCTCCK